MIRETTCTLLSLIYISQKAKVSNYITFHHHHPLLRIRLCNLLQFRITSEMIKQFYIA
jgi:hypothetical protein